MGIARKEKQKVSIKYFGMKVTSEERDQIHNLAHAKGKSAKEVIMTLVYSALNDKELQIPAKKRITAKELRALPLKEQNRILEEQAKLAARNYEVIGDGFDILED